MNTPTGNSVEGEARTVASLLRENQELKEALSAIRGQAEPWSNTGDNRSLKDAMKWFVQIIDSALSGEKNKANERLAAETPACRGGKGNEETGSVKVGVTAVIRDGGGRVLLGFKGLHING